MEAPSVLEEKYGIRVAKLTNATRGDITGALNRLPQTLTEKDNLLVYYAGHGVLDEAAGAGYWQPVDARPDTDSDRFSKCRSGRCVKHGSPRLKMRVREISSSAVGKVGHMPSVVRPVGQSTVQNPIVKHQARARSHPICAAFRHPNLRAFHKVLRRCAGVLV